MERSGALPAYGRRGNVGDERGVVAVPRRWEYVDLADRAGLILRRSSRYSWPDSTSLARFSTSLLLMAAGITTITSVWVFARTTA